MNTPSPRLLNNTRNYLFVRIQKINIPGEFAAPGGQPDRRQILKSLTITRATYPDSERTSALARASSFRRSSKPTGKLIS